MVRVDIEPEVQALVFDATDGHVSDKATFDERLSWVLDRAELFGFGPMAERASVKVGASGGTHARYMGSAASPDTSKRPPISRRRGRPTSPVRPTKGGYLRPSLWVCSQEWAVRLQDDNPGTSAASPRTTKADAVLRTRSFYQRM